MKEVPLMYKYINDKMKSQDTRMGLGIHAVRKERVRGKSVSKILNSICENGLDIKRGSSVLATISSLGLSTNLGYNQKNAIENYSLGSEIAENGVIVLVPTILRGNGEQLYVGFPGRDTGTVGNNHKSTCILDKLCCGDNEYGKLPREFILGYFMQENGEGKFKKNPNYFLEMSEDERGTFIQSLADKLTEQQKQISEAVISKDMSKLEQLSLEMYGNRDGELGNDTIIHNAMLYLNREIENTVQSTQTAQPIQETTNNTVRRRHKILLNAYEAKGMNESDLTGAHASISATKDEREGHKAKGEQIK